MTADDPINVLDGYWVNVQIYRAKNEPDDYVDSNGNRVDFVEVFFNYATASNQVPPTKTLYANAWNAIGVSSSTTIFTWQNTPYTYGTPPSDCDLLVQNQLSSIMDGWSSVLGWDRYQQQYDNAIFNNAALTDPHSRPQFMHSGSGYWIFISKDTNDVYSAVANGITSGGGGPP